MPSGQQFSLEKKMNGHLISYMNNKLFSSLLMLIYFIYELLRYFYEKQ